MQVSSQSPVPFQFKRKGGSIITSRADVWSAVASGWKLVDAVVFQQVTAPNEQLSLKLQKGQYTVVFQCRVEESVNGVYDFGLNCGASAVFADNGNVNTTSDPHDAKVYKDQFVLDVN